MRTGTGYMEMDGISTLEDAEKKIDAYLEKMVKKGYPAEQYLIIRKEVHEWRLDDGMFFKRETCEQMCELYPKEKTEEILKDAPQETPSWKTNDFWENIPEDCVKAIKELNRLKVSTCCAWDYEQTFADVWWLVLHEVDMYVEGEFCREASRSNCGIGEPDAMNLKQAQRADAWLIKWNDLFNKYRTDDISTDDYIYDGQL